MKTGSEKGISAVLILGVIAVLLTIVIPLVSRSVVDVRISKQQEEQARAFSVAEAGLEKALAGDEIGVPVAVGGITYQVEGADFPAEENKKAVYFPKLIEKNQPVTLWLIDHEGTEFNPDAPLDFDSDQDKVAVFTAYWGQPGLEAESDTAPALEITIVYNGDGVIKAWKGVYDPNATRRAENHFDEAEIEESGDYAFFVTLNPSDHPCAGINNTCYFMRMRMLYADEGQSLAVEGNRDFPNQGKCYESTARVETSGITSKLQRCVFYCDYPPIFDFLLYSGSDLNKEAL